MNYPIEFAEYCETLTLKLTALRKAVLYILWCAKKPTKAYDVLNNLLKIKPNATPPTVYRALDFFVASGILHKIESIQSYTLCCEPVKQQPTEVLMVCNMCHQVVETYDTLVHTLFTKLADLHLFQLNQNAIELKGTCQDCLEV
ncbi:MAG: Fur family transcriptional regulator [Legionellaceae bacterium]|nr:Fur family transcriptional regulator [Legionellaceae bacterium]